MTNNNKFDWIICVFEIFDIQKYVFFLEKFLVDKIDQVGREELFFYNFIYHINVMTNRRFFF